jgi:tetrathionate reductase subunit B
MIACKQEWAIPHDDFRTHITEVERVVEGSNPRTLFLPSQCNHCADSPCVTVCPTKASYIREDGIVEVNSSRCVGCKYCIPACPYNARFFNEETGIADKCTFCTPRVESGLLPACATTCLSNARQFGDLNDPDSPVSIALREAIAKDLRVWALREDLGTGPAVYYIG